MSPLRLLSYLLCTLVLLTWSAAQASAVEPGERESTVGIQPLPARASGSYQFHVGTAQAYEYYLKQDVSWQSAGDVLLYSSWMRWLFAIEPISVDVNRAQLHLSIIRIRAGQSGPASNHVFDDMQSAEASGFDDPLFKHLNALHLAELTIIIDPQTGLVSQVDGGEKIIKRLDELFPGIAPGDPPPLHEDGVKAYSAAALVHQWNRLLGLAPLDKPNDAMSLEQPLEKLSLDRHWQGDAYTLSVHPGAVMTATLLQDPKPLSAQVANITGGGTQGVVNGLPSSSGNLVYSLLFTAQTQPVEQHHQVTWTLNQVKP